MATSVFDVSLTKFGVGLAPESTTGPSQGAIEAYRAAVVDCVNRGGELVPAAILRDAWKIRLDSEHDMQRLRNRLAADDALKTTVPRLQEEAAAAQAAAKAVVPYRDRRAADLTIGQIIDLVEKIQKGFQPQEYAAAQMASLEPGKARNVAIETLRSTSSLELMRKAGELLGQQTEISNAIQGYRHALALPSRIEEHSRHVENLGRSRVGEEYRQARLKLDAMRGELDKLPFVRASLERAESELTDLARKLADVEVQRLDPVSGMAWL